MFGLPGFIQKLNNMIYRNKILYVVFYGFDPWSLTFREELRLRVFENRVLRIIFWSKRDDVQGSGKNYVMSLMICDVHLILFG